MALFLQGTFDHLGDLKAMLEGGVRDHMALGKLTLVMVNELFSILSFTHRHDNIRWRSHGAGASAGSKVEVMMRLSRVCSLNSGSASATCVSNLQKDTSL